MNLSDSQYLTKLKEAIEEKFLQELQQNSKTSQEYANTKKLVWNEFEISIFSEKINISRRTIIDYLKKEPKKDFRFPNSDTFDLICQYLGFGNLKQWKNQQKLSFLEEQFVDYQILKNEKGDLDNQFKQTRQELSNLQNDLIKFKESDKKNQTILSQQKKFRRRYITFAILFLLLFTFVFVAYQLSKYQTETKLRDTETILTWRDSLSFYKNQGNFNEAILYAKKILELTPEDSVTQEKLTLIRLEKRITESRNAIFLATASSDGTFFQIGKHIQEVSKNVIPIQALETEGSHRNIQLLLKSWLPLAILQNNNFLEKSEQGDKLVKWLNSGKGKEIFPLYHQEFHLIIHKKNQKKIKRIQDLNKSQMKVAVGNRNSGSYYLVQQLKKDLELNWTDLPIHFGKKTFEKLNKGELDAIIFTVGSPSNIKEYLHKDLMFVPIRSKNLEQSIFYQKTFLPQNIYYTSKNNFKHQNIPTLRISKPIYLMGINYQKKHPYYKLIYDLVKTILQNQEKLKKMHPTWQTIFEEKLFLKEEYQSTLHSASKDAIKDWLEEKK